MSRFSDKIDYISRPCDGQAAEIYSNISNQRFRGPTGAQLLTEYIDDDCIVHMIMVASYMHWLYTMRYFSVSDQPTNEQGVGLYIEVYYLAAIPTMRLSSG